MESKSELDNVTLVDIIDNLTNSDGGIIFINHQWEKKITYCELFDEVKNHAKIFYEMGLRKNNRVIITLDSDLECIVTFLAIIYVGAVPVCIKKVSSDSYNEYILKIIAGQEANYIYNRLPIVSGMNTLGYFGGQKATMADMVRSLPDKNDIAFIQYTSGSVGDPKPVLISHRSIRHNLDAIIGIDKRTQKTVGFSFIPLAHDMGLVGGLLSNLFRGNTILLADIQFFLRQPIKCLEIAYEKDASIFPAPNFILSYISHIVRKMKKSQLKLLFSKYSTIYIGSEPIREKTINDFIEVCRPLGLKLKSLFFCYGMAESTLITTGYRYNTGKTNFDSSTSFSSIACVGRPINGMKVNIQGADSKDNIVGTMLIKGDSVFCGYNGDKDYTQEYFNTGDIGYKQGENYFVIGRYIDSMVVNGRNIYSLDIENLLLSNFDVKECIVIAAQFNLYIFIVCHPKSEIVNSVISKKVLDIFGIEARNIYKIPKVEIPRTTSGKPRKQILLKNIEQYEKWRLK